MNFLTVEDVNTVNCDYIHDYYVLDTAKIDLQQFENVLYDFTIVSFLDDHEPYYIFEIKNSLWTGGFYVLDKNNNYIQSPPYQYNSQTGQLIIGAGEGLKLVLLLSNYLEFNINYLEIRLTSPPVVYCTLKDIHNTPDVYNYIYLPDNIEEEGDFVYNPGVIDNTLFCLLRKTDLVYDLTETILQVGNVNTVRLNVDSDYLPGGDLIGDNALDIQVLYGDKTIKVEPIKNDNDQVIDYGFQLDLTNKIDNKPVNFTVIINETDYVNPLQVEYNLKCNYAPANSFEMLQTQLTAGAEVIELTDDITFANNIIIPNPVYIIGNNHKVDLNTYNINIDKNNVKCENINFENGSACFIQEPDSKLTLTGCTFKNAIIADNYKGSVISANDDGTITELNNCTFINCHHTIYVAGELTVDNCRALYNNWNNAVDTDYSAFLTSYGGTVDITNSVFDIDYTTEELCTGATDIKFAQSLVGLSENVTFNNATASNLKNNDIFPLFNSPYNNQSHIYAKYYYPQIETCVISSPAIGKEDKAVCHTILGTDWVYKTNVQVTRADRDNDNVIRKIEWEEI